MMALPRGFPHPEQYFSECLAFLRDYQHLFNFANTDILLNNVFETIKVRNLEQIDVLDESFCLEKLNDEYLERFFRKLKRFQAVYDCVEDDLTVEATDAPLSVKKKHEIVHLTREIKRACEMVGCETVVDFGSGLGYLDQLVFDTTNYKVLGLECCESYYVNAKKRQRKYHENSLEHVKYIKHRVNSNSDRNIQEYLYDKFKHCNGFCITGLHACADLTIDAIDIFLKMDDAKALVIMPCCYHKMAENDADVLKFKNFPLSSCLKRCLDVFGGYEFITVPLLRLASQPPKCNEKFEDKIFNLVARAVLQLYAHTNFYKLKRNKRKAVKTKLMGNQFENYIQDAAANGFTLIKNDLCQNINSVGTFDLDQLRLLWRQIEDVTFKKAGIFILLQNYLQPVIENFILFDRLLYLQENGINKSRFKKIFNEETSPRCFALVAFK